MTSLLEGARRLVTRSTDLGARLAGLEEAVEASRGRLPAVSVRHAAGVVERAGARLRLSADHTVVAIAGATGSGKSSTFNALTGLEISSVGVRRPTTSWTTACVWGQQGADELLDWLEIPPRHRVVRDTLLESGREDKQMQGVVLLDLPDHDSTEVSHHLEVDRLVQIADMLVWVLDPQKYADAAIHDRYLAPLAGHRDVMLVVLNHIDTVPEQRRQSMLDDVQKLLVQDGLGGVAVLAISARHQTGIPELRTEVVKRVAVKKVARTRLEADVRGAAQDLAELTGDARPGALPSARVHALDDAIADAAGVPVVVDAVEKSTRLRAGRATGWPLLTFVSKLRPDPLKRLHLDLGPAGRALTGRARTSVPAASPVQRARVDNEVRALADEVSHGLGDAWAKAIRRASTTRLDDLSDRLDAALGATDLGMQRLPIWAGLVRVVQWVLILTAIAGALWLTTLAGMSYLALPDPDVPSIYGLPLPTLMLAGGVVLGILFALVCRILVALTATRRAHVADRRLRHAIGTVSRELVIDPVEAELAAYTRAREGLAKALS
ncbi:GTPase [Nocardioides bigeumensis]|uniref:50S ribosome-binding GTPase n=1 Tax=Nocardioides bigeumensis TaxID=433657 RepID=A0ABP5JAN3_9ACTN